MHKNSGEVCKFGKKKVNLQKKNVVMFYRVIKKMTLALVSVVLVFSCSKDTPNSVEINKSFCESIDKPFLDDLSNEVAYFHDDVLRCFFLNLYDTNRFLDEAYMSEIDNMYENRICEFEFEKIDRDMAISFFQFYKNSKPLFCNNDYRLTDLCQEQQLFDDYYLDCYFLEERLNYIFNKTDLIFRESYCFDDFILEFDNMVHGELFLIDDPIQYFIIRVYTDVILSSLNSWAEYYFGETYSGFSKCIPIGKWIKRVGEFFVRVWDAIQETVKEDAKAAVIGAVLAMTSFRTTNPKVLAAGALVGAGIGSITYAIS